MIGIKQGTIVKGYNWPEPVEIKLLEDNGDYVHIVGATILSREHIDDIIPKDEFLKLSIERSNTYSNKGFSPLELFWLKRIPNIISWLPLVYVDRSERV